MSEEHVPHPRELLRQELRQQIADRTYGSLNRAIVFLGEGLSEQWRNRCDELAHDLLSGDAQRSVAAGNAVLAFAFQGYRPLPDFWTTALGQQIWTLHTFCGSWATRAEAAALLGTSQQNVSYLIGKGRLSMTPAGQIDTDSLWRWWATHPAALNRRRRQGA